MKSSPIIIPVLFSILFTITSCGGGSDDDGGNSGGGRAGRSCPSNYIPVPGNSDLGTANFCVMKFEAKHVGGVATSQASQGPWTSITAGAAFNACADVSADGYAGEFALISNPEWMTIARNIEATAVNWSGGSVGVGKIPQGHSDNDPNAALAVSDTSDPYSDTSGDISGDATGDGWEQKRTHTLSNGNVLWDFAGNISEWVDWSAADNHFTDIFLTAPSSWMSVDDVSGDVRANDLSPSGSYSENEGMGRWIGTGSFGAISAVRRGGLWSSNISSGIFYLNLRQGVSTTDPGIGFRCVYRP